MVITDRRIMHECKIVIGVIYYVVQITLLQPAQLDGLHQEPIQELCEGS